jgi:DNA-binding GntR family transcriptional regulator
MEIDRYDQRPAYVQIADWLRSEIRSGAIEPGQAIPSKRIVRERLDVAGQTYDKAIAILKTEGLIRTMRGIGHIVQDLQDPSSGAP